MDIKVPSTPWRPSCWVGGLGFTRPDGMWTLWLNAADQPIINMSDDSRMKYAAVKATSAIMRAMRK